MHSIQTEGITVIVNTSMLTNTLQPVSVQQSLEETTTNQHVNNCN